MISQYWSFLTLLPVILFIALLAYLTITDEIDDAKKRKKQEKKIIIPPHLKA